MSKEVKTMRDSPTETVCLSQWELTNSNWTKSEQAWDQTSPSECGWQLGQTEGSLTVALGFVSTACSGLLGSYSLWMYTFLILDVIGRA
ncbi:hypothetical protein LEMLEM_LOCUS20494, partial [Lemmus lemmus]